MPNNFSACDLLNFKIAIPRDDVRCRVETLRRIKPEGFPPGLRYRFRDMYLQEHFDAYTDERIHHKKSSRWAAGPSYEGPCAAGRGVNHL